MPKLIKVLQFIYFIIILAISVAIAIAVKFFVVGIIFFAIAIEPIMNK